MQIQAEQGYIIPALGDRYVECARRLAESIKQHNQENLVCLLTDRAVNDSLFDYAVEFPYATDPNNAFANDWQVFYATPFRENIKLEADMLVTTPTDHYWEMFRKRDVVVSTGARNFYGERTDCRHYRTMFDQNDLPDVYNAITYWRLSNTAKEFFDLVRDIFQNWEQFRTLIKFPEQTPSTDVVYAVAAKIIGPDRVTLPADIAPQIVHMKRYINPQRTEDWTREYVWETVGNNLKINTVYQTGVFHYYTKDWLADEQQ